MYPPPFSVRAGLRPGGDHSRKTTTVDFYYYSKYDWSVISCTNTEPIDRNTTGLNWTELYWESRRKSKQNLSVSLSPEVWQKCFVAAISWPTSFASCRSVIASDVDPPTEPTNGGAALRGSGPSLQPIGRSDATAFNPKLWEKIQFSCRLLWTFVFVSPVWCRHVDTADWLPCDHQFNHVIIFITLKDHTCVCFLHVLADLLQNRLKIFWTTSSRLESIHICFLIKSLRIWLLKASCGV